MLTANRASDTARLPSKKKALEIIPVAMTRAKQPGYKALTWFLSQSDACAGIVCRREINGFRFFAIDVSALLGTPPPAQTGESQLNYHFTDLSGPVRELALESS